MRSLSGKQFEKLHDEVLDIVITALRDLPHLVEGATKMNMEALVPEAVKDSMHSFLGAHLASREREIRDQRREIDRLNRRVEGLTKSLERLGAIDA